jgi:putative acetyltransferase
MRVTIRPESPRDGPTVRVVEASAFPTTAEADLVDALRAEASPLVSLVAEDDGVVVGHIMFSPVTLEGRSDLRWMGLAPMAVRPARQRQGVGSALVRLGLDACRAMGVAAVVVLGHPAFYPRFGFQRASRFGLRCEYDVPDEAFMAIELAPAAFAGATGTVRYHPAFARV